MSLAISRSQSYFITDRRKTSCSYHFESLLMTRRSATSRQRRAGQGCPLLSTTALSPQLPLAGTSPPFPAGAAGGAAGGRCPVKAYAAAAAEQSSKGRKPRIPLKVPEVGPSLHHRGRPDGGGMDLFLTIWYRSWSEIHEILKLYGLSFTVC